MMKSVAGVSRKFRPAFQRGFSTVKMATAAAVGSVAALLSPLAFATPGAAIAGELAGGSSQMMLIISAVAVLLGILILWAYVKRTK